MPKPLAGDASNLNGSLNARLPLIAPSIDTGIQIKETALDIVELDADNTLSQLTLDLAKAYFGVLTARAQLDAAEAQLSAVERQLDRAQQRLEVGLGTRVDVDRTQASFDLTAVSVIRAQDALDKAQDDLEALAGQRFEQVADLSDAYQARAYPADLTEVTDNVLSQSVDTQRLRLAIAQARSAIAAADAADALTLDATASVSAGRDLTSGVSNRNASIGLSLNLPLLTGGSVDAALAKASADLVSAEANLSATERNLISATRSLYRSIATQAQTVTARNQAIKSAETAVEATESAYEVGSGDVIDVLNAQSDLFAAQSDFKIARYNHATLILELEKLQGQLDSNDLIALNRMLISE